jgi:hypothetical protein
VYSVRLVFLGFECTLTFANRRFKFQKRGQLSSARTTALRHMPFSLLKFGLAFWNCDLDL